MCRGHLLLSGGTGTGHVVLVDPIHRLHHLRRAGGVPKPPAGHGKGLGEPIEGEGAFAPAGVSRRADLDQTIVNDSLVDLVGDQQEVAPDGRLRQVPDSVWGWTVPVGIWGETRASIQLREVRSRLTSSGSIWTAFASRKGIGTATAPARRAAAA